MGSLSRSNLSSTESAVCDPTGFCFIGKDHSLCFVFCGLWDTVSRLTVSSFTLSLSDTSCWGYEVAALQGGDAGNPPLAPTSHVLFGKGFHFNWNELVFCEYLLYFYYFIFIYCFKEAINYEDFLVKALVCKNWYSSFSISFILNM